MDAVQWQSPGSYLVLGSTGGIGAILSRRLASCGARLMLAGRDVEKLQMRVNELHARASPLDATRFAEVDSGVGQSVEPYGRLSRRT
ncbi:SDR family NAD(P)-dependent oxidoreductase [Lacipirellula limnantheis]|uniref:SDR family NAD(P)-dependent oxidoreductase n=1 Tax=Lacipirellula limnantheis TaxID=2528024 RepID=UPI003703A6EB